MTAPNRNIGDPPIIDWVDVTMLDVDPLYQRPEDEKRVAKIVAEFRWDRFGALVVSRKDGARYAIIDGQHRAQAAKLHPEVSIVPAVIIDAPTVSDEAKSFVGINADRKNTSGLELFFAQLAAGDDAADTVRQVCERAGVRIPKYMSAGFKAGDSVAVSAIQSLITRRGTGRAVEYLGVLVAAKLAPITAAQIKAVDHLMNDPEFRGQIALDDLEATVSAVGTSSDVEAKRFSATHCLPMWRGLASIWFQKCKKRRASVVPQSIASERTAPSRPRLVPYAGKERTA